MIMIEYIKYYVLVLLSFLSVKFYIFLVLNLSLYLVVSEEYIQDISQLDMENEISSYEDIVNDSFYEDKIDSTNQRMDEFNFKHEHSVVDKVLSKFREGIASGIMYLLFHFLTELFISNLLFKKKEKIKKKVLFYNAVLVLDLCLVEISRFFLGSINNFSCFYIDDLFFCIFISTILSFLCSIFLVNERSTLIKHSLAFISMSAAMFFITSISAFYFNSNEEISNNPGLNWIIKMIIIVSPFTYILTHAKQIFTFIGNSVLLNINKEEKSMANKIIDL